MSHSILLKHGWQVVFNSKSFTAYQLDDTVLVVWATGNYEVYNV